ncbi:helix-turn-helix domain-containing protein [Clostridium sp.]|uniref:helix-turn-helix domain-containing protein n=1 Tax=Clostridium sp. TaxID=1506 RepID=UPI003D6CF81D
MVKKHNYGMFYNADQTIKNEEEAKEKNVDIEKLIQIQTEILMNKYNTSCIDVKQLQKELNVGQSNIYEMLKKEELPVRTIGRRKVIPVIALATYLITGAAIKK